MEKGYYTKHFNTGKDTILSFDAVCDTKDNHFEAGKLCNTNGFQVVEDRKDHPDYDFTYNDNAFVKDIQKYYNTFLYSFYNIYGERVKSMLVSFDFDNSTITVNGRTLKVVEDSDFVYKVLKTKVKAIDGIKGLYKHILEAMHVESVCNTMTWHILCKIGNIVEE